MSSLLARGLSAMVGQNEGFEALDVLLDDMSDEEGERGSAEVVANSLLLRASPVAHVAVQQETLSRCSSTSSFDFAPQYSDSLHFSDAVRASWCVCL